MPNHIISLTFEINARSLENATKTIKNSIKTKMFRNVKVINYVGTGKCICSRGFGNLWKEWNKSSKKYKEIK